MLGFLSLVPVRYWLLGACAVAALTAGGVFIHHVKQQAAADAIAAIEKANADARNKADNASTGVDACYARGPEWRWDRFDGMCKRSSGQ